MNNKIVCPHCGSSDGYENEKPTHYLISDGQKIKCVLGEVNENGLARILLFEDKKAPHGAFVDISHLEVIDGE